MLEKTDSRNEPGLATDREDQQLLERVVAGDRQAFKELYAKYYHPLLRFIFGVTGQLETAQEGVNDVMLVVWNNGASFAGRSKVRTWIMGIAYRKGLKLFNASKTWQQRFVALDFAGWNEPLDVSSEPSRSIESLEIVEHALRRLPPKQRAVVELTYRYGYSYEEIADVVDCPVNTVKTRMFHARAAMRKAAPELFGGKMDYDV